jgi:hypothetical protein
MRMISGINEVFNWLTPLDLKLRILGSPKAESTRRLHECSGNEPTPTISHEDKEIVSPTRVEPLRGSLPTLVAAISCNADSPALAVVRSDEAVGGCLYLDTKKAFIEFCNQIDIGAVAERNPDQGLLAGKPLHGRELAQVSLRTAIDSTLAMLTPSSALRF